MKLIIGIFLVCFMAFAGADFTSVSQVDDAIEKLQVKQETSSTVRRKMANCKQKMYRLKTEQCVLSAEDKAQLIAEIDACQKDEDVALDLDAVIIVK